MKHIALFTLILWTSDASGQGFNKSINKDSLFQPVTKDLPEDRKNEFLTLYKSGPEKEKEFLLFMLSMPGSSKLN